MELINVLTYLQHSWRTCLEELEMLGEHIFLPSSLISFHITVFLHNFVTQAALLYTLADCITVMLICFQQGYLVKNNQSGELCIF